MERGVYIKHRAGQEQSILAAAENLFVARGIESVKMTDIAQEAGVTKPTLYKYFSGKEDMAIRIFQGIAENWSRENEEKVWTGEGSGWDWVERFVLLRFTHALENPREISFWAEFEMLYARRWTVEEGMAVINEYLSSDHIHLSGALARGQKDGSVRIDLPPEALTASVFNFNSAQFLRMGLYREKLGEEFNLSRKELHLSLCRVFLDGLKPVTAD